jgi:hypothetical protein
VRWSVRSAFPIIHEQDVAVAEAVGRVRGVQRAKDDGGPLGDSELEQDVTGARAAAAAAAARSAGDRRPGPRRSGI